MGDIPIYKNYYLRKWSNKHSRSRVGVICTIGPSVFDPPEIDRIEELIKEGMNIARINLSHFRLDENNRKALPADLDKIVAIIKRIRECSDKLQIPVNIMLDLKGPEIRVSFFSIPKLDKLAPLAELETKERFQFTMVSAERTGLLTVKRYVLALSTDENELSNTFENESEYRLTFGENKGIIVKCERKNNDGSFDFIIKEVLPTKDKPIFKCQEHISIISNVERKGAEIKSKIIHIYAPLLQIGEGDKLVLTDKKNWSLNKNDYPVIYLDYEGKFDEDIAAQKPEYNIYLDDGMVSLKLTESNNKKHPIVEVIDGEKIELRKSMNLFNNTRESAPTFSDIDEIYLESILKHPKFKDSCPVDSIAVSFVRKSGDLDTINGIVNSSIDKEKRETWKIKLVAKIESPHCFMERDIYNKARFNQKKTDFGKESEYSEILRNELCWAIMVARGDLGVEIEPEEVPHIQQELTDKANVAGKGVIVATQMLLSMVNNKRPSRADVTDIYNAVLGGADVVMMSEETAKGKYPIESLVCMRRIINKAVKELKDAEKRNVYLKKFLKADESIETSQIMDLLGEPMVNISLKSGSPVIFSYALTGGTVTKIPKYRPDKPIVAITKSDMTARNLLFYFGVFPLLIVEKGKNGKDKADFDFPRDVKEYRAFIKNIVKTAKDSANNFVLERLKDLREDQIVFGLLGIDGEKSFLSDRAIVVFKY